MIQVTPACCSTSGAWPNSKGSTNRGCPRRRGWVPLTAFCLAALLQAAAGRAPAADPPTAEGEPDPARHALIDGLGLGWRSLGEGDFLNVNCEPGTWSWKGGEAHCTGMPVGVIRSKQEFTNFELILEWRHLQAGGNSGVFLWTPRSSLEGLQPGKLPHGIEVQVLDHGYAEQYQKQTGKAPDWFTTHGDVFPVGSSKMKPFAPVAPDGRRSFPREERSLGVGQWNHYYVRAINGEVRLWVNGEEVSGGSDCEPRIGFLCLESEGAPVEFRNLRIRELP